MTKIKYYIPIILCIFTLNLNAQTPEKINYQAVARDASGAIMASQNIDVRFSIHQSNSTGMIVYSEVQTLSTNQFGLFTAEIGGGSVLSGTFSTILWGSNAYYLQVEIDPGSGFDDMGSNQLLSVPYALYSKESLNGPAGPQGPPGVSINWLGTFTSAPLTPNLNDAYYNSTSGQSFVWDGAAWNIIAQDGTAGSLTAGTGIDLTGGVISNTGDLDSTNELQNLSVSGNNINISGGTGITISATSPSVGDYLYWNGLNWVAQSVPASADSQDLINGVKNGNEQTINIQNGTGVTFSVADADSSITNEIQTISSVGGIVTLSNGGGSFTDAVDDADNDPNNERITTFNLNATNDSLVIVEAGVGHAFPLSNLNDGDWTITGTDIYNSNIGKIGMGTPTPTALLHLNGSLRLDNLSGTAPAVGSVLTSMDALGNAEWQPLPAPPLSLWSGSAGVLYPTNLNDNIGLGIATPTTKIDIFSASNSTAISGYWTSPETTIKIHNTDQTNNNFSDITFATTLSNASSTEMGRIAVQNVNHTSGSESGDIAFMTRAPGSLSEKMRIMGTGNVGIGTAAPADKLHVLDGGLGTRVRIENSSNGWAGIDVKNTLGEMFIGVQGPFDPVPGEFHIYDNYNGGQRMVISAAGNIGFGTSNPVNKLDVEGGMAIGATYSGTNAAPGNGLIVEGNVGIGTNAPSPSGNLTVEAQASKFIVFDLPGGSGLVLAGGWSSTTLSPQVRYSGSAPGWIDIGQDVAGSFVVEGSDTPRLTVMNGGNVGVGVSTPVNKLDVEGAMTIGATYSGTNTAPTNGLLVQGNTGMGTTSPGTKLEIDGAVTYTPVGLTTTANYALNVGDRSYVRTITPFGGTTITSISNGLKPGHFLIIENVGNYLLTINDGAANLNIAGNALLYTEDTITLIWTGSKWLELSRSNN